MKNLRIKYLSIPIFVIALVLLNQGFVSVYSHDSNILTAKVSVSDSTDTKTYICPMDADVISDKPGECPKCGMDLILKEDDTKKDGKKDEKKDVGMDHMSCKGCMHKH